MKKISIQSFSKMFLNDYYGNIVVGDFGSYGCKKQKNGLIKYKIVNVDKSFDESTRKQILIQIERNEQIILMEGKNHFIVMNPPQDVSEVV